MSLINHTSLDLLIHILLRVLLPQKVAPYRALCSTLLPKALMLKNEMNACHDFLSWTKLGKVSNLYQDSWDYYTNICNMSQNEKQIGGEVDLGDDDEKKRDRIDTPIQSILYDRTQNDYGPIDALLLMDLIIVKYELYTRVISMKELKHCWMTVTKKLTTCSSLITDDDDEDSDDNQYHDVYNNTRTRTNTIMDILNSVKSYLGAPDHWNTIHPPIVQRQCLIL